MSQKKCKSVFKIYFSASDYLKTLSHWKKIYIYICIYHIYKYPLKDIYLPQISPVEDTVLPQFLETYCNWQWLNLRPDLIYMEPILDIGGMGAFF